MRDVLRERQALILAVGLGISLALRLLTWSPVADGLQARYVQSALVGVGASAAVWALVRLQTGPHRCLPLAAALVVLLAGDATHYVRLANPIAHGGPVASFTSTFPDVAGAARQWDFQTAKGGRVSFERGAVLLESPPGATAYARARLPALPDAHRQWWLPVALAEHEPTERLTWRGTVSLSGSYYVLAEIRHLLVQAVPYGIHVTYPDERKSPAGHEVETLTTRDGKVHEWRLVRNQIQLSLFVDGSVVWAAPQQEVLGQVQLGESRPDPLHGGMMRLEYVQYTATLSGP